MPDRIKSRRIVILLIIIGVVLAAAFLISYLILNADNQSTEIVLPSQTVAVTAEPAPEQTANDSILSIDPENVKSALSSVTKPTGYHRTLEVTLNSAGSLKTSFVEAWVSDGSQRFDIEENSRMKHILILDSAVYIWYEDNAAQISSFEYGDHYTSDQLQGIPSYEDVLTIDEALITDADYVPSDSSTLGSLYVEYRSEDGEYIERRWVSLETGLLTEARTLYGGDLIYNMTEKTMELLPASDAEFDGRFTLPAASPAV